MNQMKTGLRKKWRIDHYELTVEKTLILGNYLEIVDLANEIRQEEKGVGVFLFLLCFVQSTKSRYVAM